MSYSSIETGLLTLIRLLANYTATNSSAGDYRILAAGVLRALVLQPGPIITREVAQSPRRMRTLWAIDLELYIPWKGEISTIAVAIRTDRQELIDHIDKYPTLNGLSGVVRAVVRSGDEPTPGILAGRNWWRQVLRLEVEERISVTIAES